MKTKLKIAVDHKAGAIDLCDDKGDTAARIYKDGTILVGKGLWSEDMFIQIAAAYKHRKMIFNVFEKRLKTI